MTLPFESVVRFKAGSNLDQLSEATEKDSCFFQASGTGSQAKGTAAAAPAAGPALPIRNCFLPCREVKRVKRRHRRPGPPSRGAAVSGAWPGRPLTLPTPHSAGPSHCQPPQCRPSHCPPLTLPSPHPAGPGRSPPGPLFLEAGTGSALPAGGGRRAWTRASDFMRWC